MEGFDNIPSVFTTYAHSCVHCARGTKDKPLQRCGGCQRVYYCDSKCQTANWPRHRNICKALKNLETKYGEELRRPFQMLGAFSGQGVGITELANDCIASVTEVEMRVLAAEVGRPLRIDERNLVGWQPRCLACGRSNLLLRVEASSGSNTTQPALKGCPDCLLAFACNDAHWNAVETRHRVLPCQDSIDGKTQCEMNHMVLQDMRFSQFMAGAGADAGPFRWAPERTKARWTSLKNISWKDYEPGLKKEFGKGPAGGAMLEPMLRAVTEGLSMPMTILAALEILNGDDLAWSKKHVLTIHVLGAAEKELGNANIFEEILHRVPEVKTLNLVFIGPDLAEVTGPHPVITPMETCPNCTRKGRQRVHQYHGKTYDGYVRTTAGYEKPDLAVAFNSGCSQEMPRTWRPTLQVLAERHVPSVFTAYNHDEAHAESRLLEAAGATLVPELGPKKNPWGSLLSKTEPNRITGFYAVNAWLSGGFR